MVLSVSLLVTKTSDFIVSAMTPRSHKNTWLPTHFRYLYDKISLIPEIDHTALKRREHMLATDTFSNYLD